MSNERKMIMYKCVSEFYPNIRPKCFRQKTTQTNPELYQNDTKNNN